MLQSTSKGAHIGTSKDARFKAPRRMHTTKHLEGCIQGTAKDASRETAKRMYKERHARISYISKSLAKVTIGQQNQNYNELRPDQHKYSATLHPG